MKFSDILLFVSLASAAPAITARQLNALGPVTDAINTLKDNIGDALDDIKGAVEGDDPEAGDVIMDSLDTLKQALEDATGALDENTPDAVSGILPRSPAPQTAPEAPQAPQAPQAPTPPKVDGTPGKPGVPGIPGIPGVEGKPAMKRADVDQEQIDEVVEAVTSATDVLTQVEQTLDLVKNQANPDVMEMVQDNVDSVKEALVPLIEPFLGFVTSIKDEASGGGVDTGALDKALGQVKGVVSSLGKKLNLDGLKGLTGALGGI